MTSPTVDIIVPVWNNPFETRACLAEILAHSPGARLIIVDNGSSRDTELMLEEFSESLDDKGLFIKSEKNLGLVTAINLGLARSDSDFSVIVSPHVTVVAGWLDTLLAVAADTGAGIVTPVLSGAEAGSLPHLALGCSVMESCTVTFAALLLRTEMRMVSGSFDETLDGGEWCAKEYVRRVADFGYHTCITNRVSLASVSGQRFGSTQRRTEAADHSRAAYLARWGAEHHYAVYFGNDIAAESLEQTMNALVAGARCGHRFSLLLHRRQYATFRKLGWNGLHTGIELLRLGLLLPLHDLQKKLTRLRNSSPEIVLAISSSVDAAQIGEHISLEQLLTALGGSSTPTLKETPA